VTLGMQTRNAGLASALVGFTSQFSPDKPVEMMVTQQNVQAFHQCDEHTWMVMSAPRSDVMHGSKDGKGGGAAAATPDVDVDAEPDARMAVVASVVQLCWQTYVMFNGTPAQTMASVPNTPPVDGTKAEKLDYADGRWDVLRRKFSAFLPDYLALLEFDEMDTSPLMALGGIHFLPVDKQSYLRIQLMVNAIELRFADQIAATMFLYDGHLIHSGLGQNATRVLFAYLLQQVLPRQAAAAAAGGASPDPWETPRSIFIDEEDCLAHGTGGGGEGATEHQLLVHTSQAPATMVFVLKPGVSLDKAGFLKFLHPMLEQELRTLRSNIGAREAAGRGASDSEFRFVYFNRMNLALKVSAGAAARLTASREFMRQLCSMHREFQLQPDVREVCVKTAEDFWIVGRRAGEREFFLLLDHKQFSLADANLEIERLCATLFHNILLP